MVKPSSWHFAAPSDNSQCCYEGNQGQPHTATLRMPHLCSLNTSKTPVWNPRQVLSWLQSPWLPLESLKLPQSGLISITRALCFQQHTGASCSHPTTARALWALRYLKATHLLAFAPFLFFLIAELIWKPSCHALNPTDGLFHPLDGHKPKIDLEVSSLALRTKEAEDQGVCIHRGF